MIIIIIAFFHLELGNCIQSYVSDKVWFSMSRHPSFFVNNKVLTLRCVAIEFAKFLFRLSSNMSYKDGDIYFFGFSFLIAATSLNTMTSTLYSIIFAVFWI
jgi:hypothetical protein